jgi:hypothetical protein
LSGRVSIAPPAVQSADQYGSSDEYSMS